jgi:hypothetical protein
VCSRRYAVYTGSGLIVGDAESRARERVEQMHARFIDARQLPFTNCERGEVLDFAEAALPSMM